MAASAKHPSLPEITLGGPDGRFAFASEETSGGPDTRSTRPAGVCGSTRIRAGGNTVCRRTLGVSIRDEVLDQAEEILDYRFVDRGLLRLALTHASIADSRLESNERLEFLGDAVLGVLVCDYLYATYPDLLEGEMTKIKSAVVSRRMCAKITMELGLEHLLALGKGMKIRPALPSSLAAAVLESVIGAIYLDAGMDRVRAFLMPILAPHVDQASKSGHQQNFKSVLQQYAQQRLDANAEYLLLDEKGPDHAKCFEVCAEMDGRRFSSCWAPSKKQAEQQAALLALEELGLITRDSRGHLIYDPAQGLEPAADEESDDSEPANLAGAGQDG